MALLTDVKIKFISLVTKAANKKRFAIVKSEDGVLEGESFIIKQDDDKRLVTCVVYEPYVKDTHGDYMLPEDIEKAAHEFMAKYGEGADIQHDNKKANVDIVESWVAKTDTTVGGQDIKKGTWMATARVNDDLIWKSIKDGVLTGFSMGGTAQKINKNDNTEDKNMTIEEIKKAMAEVMGQENNSKDLADLKAKIEKMEQALKTAEIEKADREKQETEIKDLKATIEKMDTVIKEMSTPGFNTEETIEKSEEKYGENIRKAALADGVAIIPTPLANQMIKDMKEVAPFFAYGTHIKAKGTTITVPVRLPNVTSSAAAKKEGAGVTDGKTNLKKIILAKGVVQSNIPITDELRADSQFNIATIVREYMSEDIGEYIADATVRGIVDMGDANKPNRIEGFQKSTDFAARMVDQATAGVITWEELMEVKKNVKPQYRRKAKWYISPEAELIMKTMKDSQGRPIWLNGVAGERPNTFDGDPVEVMWQMGGAVGDVEVLYADFSRFYYYFVDYDMQSEMDRHGKEGVTDEILRTRLGGKVANQFAAYGIKKKA